MPKKRGLNPKAMERIRAERENPPTPKGGPFAELQERAESPKGRYPGYNTEPAPIRTVEDIANDFGFTYDELFGEPKAEGSPDLSHLPPPPDLPPPPGQSPGAAADGNAKWGRVNKAIDYGEKYVPAAYAYAKTATRRSPFAPMTWIEHQMSSEGRGMLYGRGPQIPPLYGYETRPFALQPAKKRNPEEVFVSPWNDPNVDKVPSPGTEIGYPEGPAGSANLPWGGEGERRDAPVYRKSNQSPEERLGRSPDLLHENIMGNLWGTPHDAAIGNIGGDTHTRATRGFGDSSPINQVESIRAPKPKN